MPQIVVLKPFKFAHRGVEIEELEPHPQREPREATQELVDHDGLVVEGYIEIVGAAPRAPVPGESGPGEQAEGAKKAGGLKVDELKAALTAQGIDIPEGAKKAELQALLDAANTNS